MNIVLRAEDSSNNEMYFYRKVDGSGAWTHVYVHNTGKLVILGDYGDYRGYYMCLDDDFRRKLLEMTGHEILFMLENKPEDFHYLYVGETIDSIMNELRLTEKEYSISHIERLRICKTEYDLVQWNLMLPVELRLDTDRLMDLFYYGYSPVIQRLNNELIPELREAIKQQLDEEQKAGVRDEEVQEKEPNATR